MVSGGEEEPAGPEELDDGAEDEDVVASLDATADVAVEHGDRQDGPYSQEGVLLRGHGHQAHAHPEVAWTASEP